MLIAGTGPTGLRLANELGPAGVRTAAELAAPEPPARVPDGGAPGRPR